MVVRAQNFNQGMPEHRMTLHPSPTQNGSARHRGLSPLVLFSHLQVVRVASKFFLKKLFLSTSSRCQLNYKTKSLNTGVHIPTNLYDYVRDTSLVGQAVLSKGRACKIGQLFALRTFRASIKTVIVSRKLKVP